MFLCLHVASSVSIAAPLGCLFIAFSLDRIGRISTFKFSLWPSFIGWMLIALAFNPNIIIIGRLLTGFAMCMILVKTFKYFIPYHTIFHI